MAGFKVFFNYNSKFRFWLLQFLFWIVNFIFDLLVNPQIRESLSNFFEAMCITIYAFCITLVLRFLFKKYKIFKLSPLFIIINLIGFSLAAGLVLSISYHVAAGLIKNQFDVYINQFFDNFWLNLSLTIYPFLAWNSLYLGYKVYEQYNLQKQHAEKALLLAQSAQLEMLRYQLNPHFLFNTLSSLRALIRNRENEIAESIVTKIAEFLKYSLLEGQESKVQLIKEIKTINYYLDIEKVRFKENLNIEFDIDTEAENILIPFFLIHSLVENAVKHGMKTSPSPLKIIVTAKKNKNQLFISISNTGYWLDGFNFESNTGTGLQNTRKRLEIFYPQRHIFEIIKLENSVTIKIIIDLE